VERTSDGRYIIKSIERGALMGRERRMKKMCDD
jgi:hypothetical protein